MSQVVFCPDAHPGLQACWAVAAELTNGGWFSLDKLWPAMLTVAGGLYVWWLNRSGAKRNNSLELFKEFYSTEMGKQRRHAEKFVEQYADVDWTATNPYEYNVPDDLLSAYGAVTRYLARLAIVYDEKELNRTLTGRLLAHPIGYWWGLLYEEMTKRSGMYTGSDIEQLVRALELGKSSKEFGRGAQDGRARRESWRIALKQTTEVEEVLGHERNLHR